MRDTRFLLCAAVVVALLAGGCAAGMKTRHYSSVVDYLYPNTRDPVVPTGITTLSVPIRVGIAFVPGSQEQRSGMPIFSPATAYALTEKKRTDLMNEAAEHFKRYEFVEHIEIIPSAYLTPRGGFTNLEQLRVMYGVDVIALISFDQVQFTDEGLLSLTYWTVIGAYVVPGDKNDTHTMLDAAVFDVASRRMLFRAPGVSHIKGRATLANLSEQLRKDSEAGFAEASRQMITNLDLQLESFRERLKQKPKDVVVEYRGGYRGAGAVDWIWLVLGGLGALVLLARRGVR